MKHIQSIFVTFLICITALLIGCSDDNSRDILNKATVSFSDETYRIVESSSDDIRIPIGLDTPYHSGGSVDVTVTGGILGEDYTLDQPGNTFTVTFSDVSVLEFFSITPIDDNRLNQDVELEITLSNPTGSLKLGLVSFLQVILLDDEELLTAEVSFEEEEYEVNENETIEIPINFNNLSTDGGTITIVAGGGDAVYGEDYVLGGANDDGEVTLSVEEYGDTATLSVTALDNDLFEENKTFQIQILEVSGGITIAQENTIAEVTIIEDDASPFTTIGFNSTTTTSVNEDTSEVTIELELSQALTNNEMVSINVGNASTAILGEDFTFENGSTANPLILNLEAGSDSATFTIQLNDDDSEEDDETIEFSLTTDSQNLEIDDNNSTLTFTIVDNDGDDNGGGDAPIYLETFESYNNEENDFLVENLNFERFILSGQTMPDSEIITVINNSGSFSDVENVAATSDNGLNIFTNTQNNTELPVDGTIDQVIVTPAIENVEGDLTINVDLSYAFKNQNSAMIEFYYSDTYSGSGNWDESQWNSLGTETVADLDSEGFGNNDYKREEFNVNASGTIYFAIRITNQMSADNYRFRFRFDNIKITSN